MVSVPVIILASASPRRAALLQQIGLPFRVDPSGLDENDTEPMTGGEPPAARACRLARAKAEDVATRLGHGLVIGADTIVVCEGIVFGKPRDSNEALEILLRLAGQAHHVITGVAVMEAGTQHVEAAAATTRVQMRAFDRLEATAYVATGEPLDKAGAYAIQGHGALLVERIEGDYSNVVGLPLSTLAVLLRRFGLDIWEIGRT